MRFIKFFSDHRISALTIMLLTPPFSNAATVEVLVTNLDGDVMEYAVASIHTEFSQIASPDTVAIMDQVDRQYAPAVLAIQQGTQVSFPNSDDVRHHVYSFSHPNDFEIKLYHGRPAQPQRFNHAGVVVLGCNIHDGMLGYIQVVDTPWFATSDSDGIAQINNVSVGEYLLQVWHPDAGMSYQHIPVAITDGQNRIVVSLNLEDQRKVPELLSADPLQALFED